MPLLSPGPWTRTRAGSQPSVTGTRNGLLGTEEPSYATSTLWTPTGHRWERRGHHTTEKWYPHIYTHVPHLYSSRCKNGAVFFKRWTFCTYALLLSAVLMKPKRHSVTRYSFMCNDNKVKSNRIKSNDVNSEAEEAIHATWHHTQDKDTKSPIAIPNKRITNKQLIAFKRLTAFIKWWSLIQCLATQSK